MSSTRELAAIMFTDIVGYTSLMGKDEKKAFDLLRKNREIQKPLIKHYNGTWVKELGDGVLASFHTVTDAVFCAAAIHQTCSKIDGLQLRVGIHLGEVIFENNDVFGDGVNIASRLQAMASPGSTWVSEAVYKNLVNKKEITSEFIKEETLKNVSEPVKVYEITVKEIPGYLPDNIKTYQKQSSPEKKGRKKTIFIAIVILLLVFAATFFLFFNKQLKPAAGSKAKTEKSIAVLPFVNLNADPEQEYFSDGITVDIITQLSQISDLRVSARSVVMRYKNTSEKPREIASALKVNTLLEGTIRLNGDRVIVTANLIDAETEKQLWAEKYDRELKDIFTVQADVAEQIATAMRASLTTAERNNMESKPTDNIEAYQLYLKGRYHYGRNSFEEANQALQFFTQALKIDPNYALAFVGLSQCYALFGFYQYPPFSPSEAFLKAKEAAIKALEINPGLSEAHAALAYVLRTYDWDWEGAENSYVKALNLNYRNPIVHDQLALLYSVLGKFDQAIQHAKEASELDPLTLNTILDVARVYNFAGKVDEAVSTTRNALQLDRNFVMFHGMMAALYEQKGQLDSALMEFRRCGSRTGLDYEGAYETFVPVEASSYREYWQKTLRQAIADSENRQISNFIMAVLYIRNGDHENALRKLEKAYQEREGPMVYVNVEPVFKPLRKNPGFKELLGKMGFK